MSDERKRAGAWPWIATLLVGLPVLYVASFGPVCWITASPPPFGRKPHRAMIVYWPLGDVAMGKGPIGAALQWWIRLGTPEGRIAMIPTTLEWNHAVGFGKGPFEVESAW